MNKKRSNYVGSLRIQKQHFKGAYSFLKMIFIEKSLSQGSLNLFH